MYELGRFELSGQRDTPSRRYTHETLVVEAPTGVFVLSATSILAYQRISADTGDPLLRLVATITLGTDQGLYSRPALINNTEYLNGDIGITNSASRITITPSGMLMLEPLISNLTWSLAIGPFTATWSKGIDGAGYHMWADPDGGVLVRNGGALDASDATSASATLLVGEGRTVGFAVLPAARRNRSVLYGTGLYPHVTNTITAADLAAWLTPANGYWTNLTSRFFGVVTIFGEDHYTGGTVPVNLADGTLGYVYNDPTSIAQLITEGHALNFKMIGYLEPHRFQSQSFEVTRAWMRSFQSDYNLDGWYLDGLRFYTGSANLWPRDLDALRKIRFDVGETGILYAHNTIDLWGSSTGFISAPALAEFNYTLHGENVTVDDVDDPYFTYVSRGYGPLGAHKRGSSSALTQSQIDAIVAGWGTQRIGAPNSSTMTAWDTDFVPTYNTQRDAWRAANE